MATFNGYKNWNHWNVSLWINNNEELYKLAKYCIRTTKNRTAAAKKMVGMVPPKTPDGAPFTYTSIKAAMTGM